MFPPVRLKTRSRSGGASTWRSMTALLKFGAYLFSTSKHRSANASRWSSQELSRSSYGAYWMNIDIRWLPGWRHRRVHHRGKLALDHRVRGRPPVLGIVERALDVVLVGTDVDGAPMLRPGLRPGQRAEVRQLLQGHVDLQRGARVADPLDVGHERLRQHAPVEQLQKRHVRVGVAGHDRGVELVA